MQLKKKSLLLSFFIFIALQSFIFFMKWRALKLWKFLKKRFEKRKKGAEHFPFLCFISFPFFPFLSPAIIKIFFFSFSNFFYCKEVILNLLLLFFGESLKGKKKKTGERRSEKRVGGRSNLNIKKIEEAFEKK